MFNPSRLTVARQRRGLTKRQLASQIETTEKTVQNYESGEMSPSEESLVRLSSVLGFPPAFFEGDDLEILTPDIASFRSLKRMKAAQRDMALSAGSIALVFSKWIDQHFDLPPPALPRFEPGIEPEAAAMALRREWGLGARGIRNMVHLLESKGIKVFSLDIAAVEVDAFSMWYGEQPYVFLNTQKTAEHSRFDAAHELGHLVLHRHGQNQGADAEKEANEFAAAFLMPRDSVQAKAPRFVTISSLIAMKKEWGVSVAALNYRLHSLGLTSEWVNRSICIELSKMGYRTSEPEPIPHENSQVLQKVLSAMRAEGMGRVDIARSLNLQVSEIDKLTFGLSLTDGASVNSKAISQDQLSTGKKFELRLIK
ncbi:XRE family transcriptional regulator [Aquitalea sp. FJL05]|uniref:helix-turn-helix domain-containing protein n=1 Tax=Aquitalea sp. FJL05 TaxID=2153366 RepID=UPI000F5B3604|nr:XRE family transcriptional regulator [Aquitalea sp. FJL05]RQO68246.1 XRE family transcriptional regulator [Aquitalea sp. FJL05]